ncbi:MAG: peptidyl-prolyl cis-trans isomerase [Desulfobulbaceae bacterium]|nr:MAG: peptidyl-prolyl cis-trans isomerase [Desulfobulbaceae bacterium]
MLQILRNKAQSTIIQGVVLVIALVFIFWGVGTNMMQSGRDAAIVVNDQEISFQDFQQRYEQTINDYRRQFGDAISDEVLKGLGVKQQVINQLTQSALLRQGTQAMGLMVAPVEIQTTIQKMPHFQKEGAFNLEIYKALLTANRMTPHSFEASISDDILTQKGLAAINSFASIVSDTEIIELYQREQETVTVNVVKVSPALFLNTIVVDGKELADWFETEKNRYKGEQKIKLKYLPFHYKSAMAGIPVSDEQILARYEKEKGTYQVPEKRQARHILFKADKTSSPEQQAAQLKKAEDTLAKARTGKDFATLAKTLSEDTSKTRGGDLGAFTQGRMVKEFDDAVFSMQPGAISDIVTTAFGYHIIKLEKILPATTRSIEEVRAEIVSTLQAEQTKPATFQLANTAYEDIISAGSLQAYADKHTDKSIVATDFFSRTTPPADLESDPKFLDTVFSLKQGELSSLIETPSGYFIVFTETIQEPTLPTLDAVKERATQDYKLVKARKMAQETAQAFLTKMSSGADIAAAAQEAHLTILKSGPLRKNNPVPDPALPASLVEQALRLGPKAPFPKAPLTVSDDHYVLQFLERKVPDPATLGEATKKEYKTGLLQQKQDRLLGAWLQHQEKNSTIITSKNLLN